MVSPEDLPMLVALLGAAAFAAVIFVFVYPYLSGDRQKEKRLSSVTESRANKVASRSAAETAANRRKQVADTLKDIEKRDTAKQKITLRMKLQRAGLEDDPKNFYIASAVLSLVCAIGVYFSIPNKPFTLSAAMTAAFIGAFGLPRFILSKMIKRRQNKFLNELANSIDVIVRGVKSGLPLNECLQVIARESPEPVCTEFREVVEQQRIGVPLGEALERLIGRMPLSEVKFLSIVIAIQQQAGGNLSEALGNLSGVLRDRLKIKLKVAALSGEAKSSAMVLACLPPGVVVMVSMSAPDYIAPLFDTRMGNVFIAIGLGWMGIGCLVMRKMINFKY